MNGSEHALPERKESLWRIIVSPTIWAVHFMLCYITAAIWCAKFAGRDDSLQPVRWAIVAYTAVALIGIAWNGWDGFRRHRLGNETAPHDDDTPEDRHRFLGFATALLAALSAVATIYAALVVIFFRSCR
ncbi:MAG TPA: hypothetical protein VFT12_01985 [Thermoanaerobaculia bacterium]|nr:hypothetical protein [Thermoanaerobaculia bacterium]